MKPGRFVTLCFLYSGLALLAQYVLVSGLDSSLGGLAQLGTALAVTGTGVYRLWNPDEERQNPAEWGPFAYVMAALVLVLTAALLAVLLSR